MNNIVSMGETFGYSRPKVHYKEYQENLKNNQEAISYLKNERGLNNEAIEHFLIGATERNEIAIPIFKNGQLIDYKLRSIKGKIFRRMPSTETWVINEDVLDTAKEYIVITEGELDTISVWQMGIKNVISGTSGAQSIQRADWIKKLPPKAKIFINYDNDEPGQESARKLADRIGIERCYNIILPVKDANEFLTSGGTKEKYIKILKEAKRFDVEGIYKISDVIDDLQKNKIKRIPTFLKNVNDNSDGGIPRKSMVVISGEGGIGKSTLLMNMLIDHSNNGLPTLLISFENDIHFTIQRLIEIKYKTKTTDFKKEDWDKIKEELTDYPLYVDVSMATHSMDKIKTVIDQAKKLYGIEFLGYDNIGFLPNRNKNVSQELSQMSRDFKMLAIKNDIIVYLISHIRKKMTPDSLITGEDLKDTQSLKGDADIIYIPQMVDGKLMLYIDKARMSKSKIFIPISFNGETGEIKDDNKRKILTPKDVEF